MKSTNRKWHVQVALTTALIAGLTSVATGLPIYAESAPSAAQGQSAPVQQGATAVQTPIPLTTESVTKFADAYFSRPDVQEQLKGALFLVVKDGKILLNKGYGYADVESKKPINPNTTVFRMASISKVMTTTAVMQLAEQGKIDLDRDISEYMGGVTIPNKTGVPLTMKNLMTHTTGYDYTDSYGTEPHVSLEDYVKANIPTVIRKPGEAYRYDNMAFEHQGYIVQNVSKLPFEDYMKKYIFKPLGMNRTDFVMSSDIKSNLAKGYDSAGNEIPVFDHYPEIFPSGGALSTGSDMANFILAMLNGGKLGDNRILEEQTTQTMESFHYGINPKLPVMSYGFESFFNHLQNGESVIGKGGDLPGFHSWMWMLPERNVGALVIVNGDLLDPRPELFGTFMQQFYPDQRPAAAPLKPTKEQLKRFEGMYRNLRFPMFVSKIAANQDGTLTIQDQMGTHKLKQLEDLLFQDEQGWKAGFREGADGEINYFYYNSPPSFSEKLPNPQPYRDVPEDDPYASYISLLSRLQIVCHDETNTFRPEETITRAEFVQMMIRATGFQLSKQPVLFADSIGHPLAQDIQTAVEMFGLEGVGEGRFEPDRAITRQEAAVLMWKLARAYLTIQPQKATLSGTQPSEWALDGVQFVIAAKLYGPETKLGADGAVDYEPARPMLRKEAAASLALFSDRINDLTDMKY